MVENHKMIVENSGLLTVAALRHLDFTGKKVVSILSGGNMDVITMSSVVQHGLIQRDRIFTVSVLLPDRPGELVNVAQVIAESKGQRRPTRPQPVRHDQPQRRRGAARDHRGVRHRAQAANRRGARGKGLPPAPYPGAPVIAGQAGVVSRPQSIRHHPRQGRTSHRFAPACFLKDSDSKAWKKSC